MLMDNKDSDEAGFKYNPDDKPDEQKNAVVVSNPAPQVPLEKADEPLFNWASPDSFSARKSFAWYLILLVGTVVVSGIVYLLTADKITTAVIVVSGLLIGFYGSKKPRMVKYQLTRYGFTINGRYYEFGRYRSFAVVNHGDGRSAVLTPLKRFMPYVYIYFENDIEPQITSALTDVLPKENAHTDTIDRVLRKIGF
jgi:hypothetical protein